MGETAYKLVQDFWTINNSVYQLRNIFLYPPLLTSHFHAIIDEKNHPVSETTHLGKCRSLG